MKSLIVVTILFFSSTIFAIPTSNTPQSARNSCEERLAHPSYDGMVLLGDDAREIFFSYPDIADRLPNHIDIGPRWGETKSYYVDFSQANRDEIDQFLKLLRAVPRRSQIKPNNAAFDVYKAAGLRFDGAEAEALASAVLQRLNPTVRLYVNNRISIAIEHIPGVNMTIDLSRATAEEVIAFVKTVTEPTNPYRVRYEMFERTFLLGVPILRNSKPIVGIPGQAVSLDLSQSEKFS